MWRQRAGHIQALPEASHASALLLHRQDDGSVHRLFLTTTFLFSVFTPNLLNRQSRANRRQLAALARLAASFLIRGLMP